MNRALGVVCSLLFAGAALAGEPRPFTVRDAIEMTRPALHNEGATALASPSDDRTAILLRRADVAHDRIIYELRVYGTGTDPLAVAALDTMNNTPAVSQPRWRDENTLAFLGLDGNGVTQACTLDVPTGKLIRLTHSQTPVVDFAVSGNTIVYLASLPDPPPAKPPAAVVIDDVDLVSLVNPEVQRSTRFGLYVAIGGGLPRLLRELRYPDFPDSWSEISVSPSGAHAVVTFPVPPPLRWKTYASDKTRALEARWSLQYTLVDLATGGTKPLYDAPTGIFNNWPTTPRVAWAPDERSVVVSDRLSVSRDGPALDVAEIDLDSGRVRSITDAFPAQPQNFAAARWVSDVRWIGRASLDVYEFDNSTKTTAIQRFTRNQDHWAKDGTPRQHRPHATFVEDASTSPRLVLATAAETQTIDLNPQLASVAIAPVETFTWTDKRGTAHRGGLVLPPGRRTGERVPLVIQVREFNDDRFLADGPFTTAHAAQALAASGIAVLQSRATDPKRDGKELEIQQAAIEAAIDALDRRGLIDRTRVGLTGFSRTCWAVKHFLVASKYPIAAAITADGIDGGYFQYLMRDDVLLRETIERVNGGPPFARGLARWGTRATPFQAHRIKAPLRIEAIGTVLGEWEMFSALRGLKKPVELVFYPLGTHELARPSEIFVSQDGAVDWYRFWLKGEEDPSLTKAEQYARWRRLHQ